MNFIHVSTCLLLWWWHDDVACSMFIFLQNCLILSEMKLPPTSNIIFFGKQYSGKKIIMHASIMVSVDTSSAFYDWKFAVII